MVSVVAVALEAAAAVAFAAMGVAEAVGVRADAVLGTAAAGMGAGNHTSSPSAVQQAVGQVAALAAPVARTSTGTSPTQAAPMEVSLRPTYTSTGISPTQATPMEVSLRPTATAAATVVTALLDLDQSAARDKVAADVAVPGSSDGGTMQVVPAAEELPPSSHRPPTPVGGSMTPSLRQVETVAEATSGGEQPSLDHLAAHRKEPPVAVPTVDPTLPIPHATTDTCSAAAAPALRVEGGLVRGDSAPRGSGASTADMNYDTGIKPVWPPSAFDSAKEGDLSRLASLHPGAERGTQWDATLNGPKPGTGPGCTSAELKVRPVRLANPARFVTATRPASPTRAVRQD